MGLMDIFARGPLSEQKIAKSVKLLTNPYAQPDVRMREMQRLLDDGNVGALEGLLKRFAANANGQIADEEEKMWLEDTLVELGEDALGPLRFYIRSAKQLSYALRAYRRIAGDEEGGRFFIDILQHHGPDAYREVEAKLQILGQLSELVCDERVMSALVPFMLDHSDEVRFAVLGMLEDAAQKKILSEEKKNQFSCQLLELVSESSVGPRIQRTAAEFLSKYEWQVPEHRGCLTRFLDPDYFIDKKRFLRRRVKIGAR